MLLNSAQVVVLAGGASRRMGSPKALLPFVRDDRTLHQTPETFLDHILAVYRTAGIERATVVWPYSARRDERILHYLARPKHVSIKISHEFHTAPLATRLDSVLRGLRHSDRTSSTFLQDVDRPFINTSVLGTMLASRQSDGYSAPNISGHAGHPLLLSPYLVSQFSQVHKPDNLTLRDLLEPYPCSLVRVGTDESKKLEININTPEEYRVYFSGSVSVEDLVTA